MLKYNVYTKTNKLIYSNKDAKYIAEKFGTTIKEVQRSARKGYAVNKMFYVLEVE